MKRATVFTFGEQCNLEEERAIRKACPINGL